jgi:tight adherence protein C
MMFRRLWSTLALVAVITIYLPGAASADGFEVSEVKTDNYPRVIVRFSASAPDGAPITDIRPDQLTVWENGVPQQQVDLYSLRESSAELWVSLIIDVSGSMNDDGKLAEAKEAAKSFVSRLRAKDRTSIVTFSDRVILHQQPTGDPGILRRAIDSLQAKGPTRMHDGLARGVSEVLRARPQARRAVILLSDGEDTDSQFELGAAMAPAIEAGVPIYTIGLGQESKADLLRDVAAKTRGRFYTAPKASDLDYVFRLLSGQLSSQYEAWWPSTTLAESGRTVEGRMVLQAAGAAPLETHFSYVMPVVLRQQTRDPHVAGGEPLRAVELNSATAWALPVWWPLIAAALAGIGVYIAYYGVILRVTRSRLQQRLSHFVASYQRLRGRAAQGKSSQKNSLQPMVLSLARLTHRLTPSQILDKLRHRLVLAGRPTGWQFAQFLSAKLILAGVLSLGGFLIVTAGSGDLVSYVLVVGCLAALGYYLPHPWLSAQIKARQHEIQRALPDTLDLLTVGVGAGLSLDGAILEVVQKTDHQLSHELANFLAELRMGRSRKEALQGLDARTEVEDIRVLVASLIQAEELGMSLSETLIVQADQMRLRRRQRAEELAHKATIKMMFPMVMLIFPALFIVIMGPAVPSLISFMSGTG